MYSTEGMKRIKRDTKPDASHRMGPERSTVVSCTSDERFGTVTTCKACKGNFIAAGQGLYADARLLKKCRRAEFRLERTFEEEFDTITRAMAEGQLQSAASWRTHPASDAPNIVREWEARAEATNEIRKRLGFKPITKADVREAIAERERLLNMHIVELSVDDIPSLPAFQEILNKPQKRRKRQ